MDFFMDYSGMLTNLPRAIFATLEFAAFVIFLYTLREYSEKYSDLVSDERIVKTHAAFLLSVQGIKDLFFREAYVIGIAIFMQVLFNDHVSFLF